MSKKFKGREVRAVSSKGKADLAVENTVCHLQVLGLGTDCDDAAPSLLLFFDRQRYLFNAGEGFQRFCMEHKIKMNRINSCLLTRLTPEACGGLPGMCLTMAEVLKSQGAQLDVIGPNGAQHLANAARACINNSLGGVSVREFGTGPAVENDLLSITPVLLQPALSTNPVETAPVETADRGSLSTDPPSKKPRLGEGSEPQQQHTLAPPAAALSRLMSPGAQPAKPCSASYICELTRVAGKFLPAKAQELGVPRGHLYGVLKGGQPVTLQDGTTIQPFQVTEAQQPGPIAVVADCPDDDYIESFVSSSAWAHLWEQTEEGGQRVVDVVCHFTPPQIIEREDYQRWISKFGSITKHLYINSTAAGGTPTMGSSALMQARLNVLHQSIFPLHQYTSFPPSTQNAQNGNVQHTLPSSKGGDSGRSGKPDVAVGDSQLKKHAWNFEGSNPLVGSDTTEQRNNILGGPSREDTAITDGKEHIVEGDRLVEGTDLEVTAGGLRKRRGDADAQQQHVSEADKRGIKSMIAAAAAGQESAAPGASGASALFAEPSREQAGCSHQNSSRKPSLLTTDNVVKSFIGSPHPRENGASQLQGAGQRKQQEYRVQEGHIAGQNLLKMHLRPPTRRGCFDEGEMPEALDFSAAQAEVRDHADVMTAVAEAASPADDRDSSHQELIERLGRDSLEIVFLGTGAAIPSKYRNVTGIYLDCFDKGGMLVDCGEGTYGQLKRKYGVQADEVIRRLRLVWISHIHADHHAGLSRILSLRGKLLGNNCQPLLVIGPRTLHRVLQSISKLQHLSMHFIENSQTAEHSSGTLNEDDTAALKTTKSALGLHKLESFAVEHCSNAYGLLLEAEAGWKVVFSGDTRPCSSVVRAAENATVLIHEATFDDGLEEEAVSKRHSMTCEAVEIGQKAKAYRTLLTHFSQRYPKIPVIDPSFQKSTCIAFDLMTVNLADLPVLPSLVAPLIQLFEDSQSKEQLDEL